MKLICVLQPSPGETVYSLEAATARLSPSGGFITKITGGHGVFARPLWPVGLQRIVQTFPDVSGITADELLWRHTLVPAFAPLLTDERRAALIKASLYLNAGEPAIISGACAGGFSLAPTLRVCPRCIANKNVRPCWRCVHQCDGVVVCPDHPDTVLLQTNVLRSPIENRRRLIDIRDALITRPCANLGDRDIEKAQSVAANMQELLEGNFSGAGPERFRLWLREKLRDAGFAAAFGKVDLRRLTGEFATWLTPTLSLALGVPQSTEANNANWIVRLVGRHVAGIHPLKAVLIACFLRVSIRDALDGATRVTPSSLPTRPMERGMPPCYRRYERNRAQLKRLWANKRFSIIEIGRKLGVKDTTVNRWAAKCGLPFPRAAVGIRLARGFTPRPTRPDFGCRLRAKKAAWLVLRAKRRSKMVCTHHPARPVYQWLLRYAPGWLRLHPLKRRQHQAVDWNARDRLWAAAVRPAAKIIRSRYPAVRVSRTRLALRVGGQVLLETCSKKLPQTSRAICRVEETHAAFVPRRLLALHSAGDLRPRAFKTALKKRPELKKHATISALVKLY